MTGTTLLRLTPIAALLATLPLHAEPTGIASTDVAQGGTEMLQAVSITATRLAKDADEVAPNVSVLAPDGGDPTRVRNLQTLFDDEPGVSVNRDPLRRGIGSINIRGIDGNRVLMQVDGITLPALYQGGGTPISGRDMVELDTLSAVEIAKGPYSGLYGADAIGGVVAYRTLDMADLLKAGQTTGGRISTAYYDVDNSYKISSSAAAQLGRFSALLAYTGRKGDAAENHGSNDAANSSRTTPNPTEWESNALLAKLDWQLAPGHSVSLVRDIFHRSQDADLLTSRTSAITSQTTSDKARRSRTSVHYTYEQSGTGLTGIRLMAYDQHGESRELALETRTGNVLRTNDAGFIQDSRGLSGQMSYRLDQGSLMHTLLWGADLQRTDTSRPRFRLQTNANGSTTTVVGGEVFPQKTFPENESERIGLFVQDEILLASGLTLTPSLRYDRFTLTPQPDALFANANPSGHQVARYRDSAISPRISLSLPLATGWTGFAQAGTGFRAPNFDDAMLVFSNLAQGYEVLPNPNLKAERSRSVELGTRYQGTQWELALTGYHSSYRDFIESVLVSPRDTNGNGAALEYQSQNIARVRIQGLELKTRWSPVDALSLRASLAYGRGDKLGEHTPLDSIDPLRASLGIDYRLGPWQTSLNLRGAQKKTRTSSATLFKTPGYGVLDLTVRFTPSDAVTVSGGLYNLADKRYWLWNDVKGQLASATVLDRYTQAGRHAGLQLDYRF